MWSMFIFYLFSSKRISIKENKILNCISKYSFGIYLIHTFWLNIANKGLHIFPNILPIGIGELAFWIIALILSILSCMIIYKLPILKRIL